MQRRASFKMAELNHLAEAVAASQNVDAGSRRSSTSSAAGSRRSSCTDSLKASRLLAVGSETAPMQRRRSSLDSPRTVAKYESQRAAQASCLTKVKAAMVSHNVGRSVDHALSERARLHLAKQPTSDDEQQRGSGNKVMPTDASPGMSPRASAPAAGEAVGELDGTQVHIVKHRTCLLLPHATTRRALISLVRMAILVELTLLPYSLAFGHGGAFGLSLPILLLLDAFNLIDVLATFLTAFTEYGTQAVVTDPRKIAMHYLCTYLIVDLIPFIPWWVWGGPTAQLIRLLRLRHFMLSDGLEMPISPTLYYRYRAISRLVTFVMLLHTMTCAYYGICSSRPAAVQLWTNETSVGPSWEEVTLISQVEEEATSGEAFVIIRPLGGLNLYFCAAYQTLCLFLGESVLSDDAPTGQRIMGMLLMMLGVLVVATLITDVNEASAASNMSRLRFQKRLNLISEKME